MNATLNIRSLPEWVPAKSRQFCGFLVRPAVNKINTRWPAEKPWPVHNLANFISVLRNLASIFVAYQLFYSDSSQQRIGWVIAIALLVLSDGLDGEIARNTNSVTTLGKAIDPLADKVLFLALSLSLVIRTPYPGASWENIFWVGSWYAFLRAAGQEIRLSWIGFRVGVVARKLGVEPDGSVGVGKLKFGLQALAIVSGWLIFGLAGMVVMAAIIVIAMHYSLQSYEAYATAYARYCRQLERKESGKSSALAQITKWLVRMESVHQDHVQES